MRRSFPWRALVPAAVFAALPVSWLLLSGDPPLEIDPDTSELVQVADNSGDLRFAVAPVMSPERTTNEYRVLAGHLATEL